MHRHFILNFTPTGLIPTRDMAVTVPLLPEEIVEQTLEAAELGASMVHLHARDSETGRPTHRKEVYAEIIAGIRRRNKDLVLCVSTSGRAVNEFHKRAEVLDLSGELKPDMASLTLSSLNFNHQVSVNSPDTIQGLARRMLDAGIKPELEAFDLGMINYARYLLRKDLLRPPFYFNLILGNVACAQADLMNLGLMVRDLPEGSVWSAGGVGRFQLQVNAMALVAGGGIRVGLEDNVWYDEERTRVATNRDLIERVLVIAGALGRKPLPPRETRRVLGLS